MAYTTIKKPSDYFNTKLYTGNGSTQSITGVNFQPDWIWFKVRSEAGSHRIVDSVRGNTKYLYANGTDAEATVTTNVTSFDSDGFSLGNGSVNENTRTYVSWNWLADNTSGSSNTDGTVTSTVSVNTTSGFSIVKWTGTGNAEFIGHGLGANADVVIIKNLGSASFNDWYVNHKSVSSTKTLYLNKSDAETTSSIYLNTAPDSTRFRFDSDQTADHIAYCFSEVKGFSKFGSYVGNGSTDGTFVYTGFKPAWVIQKPIDAVQNWQIHDTKRDGYNPKNDNLSSNNSNSEADNKFIDILSNGFKLRRSDVLNVSGDNYIYMAFAEEPLVGDNPATAR